VITTSLKRWTIYLLIINRKKEKQQNEGKEVKESKEEKAQSTSTSPTSTSTSTTTLSPSPPVIRAVVWAHNSHLGDARATEFLKRGEHNLGQLVREKYGLKNTFNVGFTTYNGTVSAARRWGGKRQTMTLNDALPESYENMFHHVAVDMKLREEGKTPPDPLTPDLLKLQGADFGILLRSNSEQLKPNPEAIDALKTPRIERAVGVQYVKDTEYQSHYVKCCLPKQFDFVIHIDKTTALKPIDPDE